MPENTKNTNQTEGHIALPEQLTSSVDLARIIRELEALDESLRQAQIRKPGTPTKLARSSVTLEELARMNKVVLTDQKQREQLLELLQAFLVHAPRIHMSLATEPSAAFTRKIVVWLRANIHPVILLDVGLQPTLAAGCIIRTNNKVFDMSLRHHFTENRRILVEKIVGPAGTAAREQTDATSPSLPAVSKPMTQSPAQPAAQAAPQASNPPQTEGVKT